MGDSISFECSVSLKAPNFSHETSNGMSRDVFKKILATICNERFLVPSLSYFPRVGRVGVFTFFDLSFKNAFSVERQTPLRTGCRHHHGLRNWQLRKKEKSNYLK